MLDTTTLRPGSRTGDRNVIRTDSARHRRERPMSSFVLPGILSKNAPARVRAKMEPAGCERVRRPVSAIPMESKPLSAQQRFRPRSAEVPDTEEGFEEELLRIGTLESTSPMAQSSPIPPTATAPPNVPAPTATGAVGRPIHVPYRPDIRAKVSVGMTIHTHCQPKPMTFRDFHLLAEACQRAGKARMEGHAYYKIAELLAQKKDTLAKSVPYFQKYLNICRRLNDLQGEAKSLNCLGIVFQEIGTPSAMERSLEYHQKHCDIADAAGVFIAHTNMGLITGNMGDCKGSIEHHKQALQFAVRAQDKQAESLSLANLSAMERTLGDHSTAKVCVERNLELSNDLRDEAASCDAYEQLGMLSSDKKEWAVASDFLTQALDLSQRHGNHEKMNSIRCSLGFVNGTMRMDDHFKAVAKLMGSRPERRRKSVR